MKPGTLKIFAFGIDPQDPTWLALASRYAPPLPVVMYEAIGPDGTVYEDIKPGTLVDFLEAVPHSAVQYV